MNMMKRCFEYCCTKCKPTLQEIGATWLVAFGAIGLLVLAGATGIL